MSGVCRPCGHHLRGEVCSSPPCFSPKPRPLAVLLEASPSSRSLKFCLGAPSELTVWGTDPGQFLVKNCALRKLWAPPGQGRCDWDCLPPLGRCSPPSSASMAMLPTPLPAGPSPACLQPEPQAPGSSRVSAFLYACSVLENMCPKAVLLHRCTPNIYDFHGRLGPGLHCSTGMVCCSPTAACHKPVN